VSTKADISNHPHNTAAIVRQLFGKPELLLPGKLTNSSLKKTKNLKSIHWRYKPSTQKTKEEP